MNFGHSMATILAKKGIPNRLASPDQPSVPKTRVYIEARDIAFQVYGQLADYLTEWEQEQQKKPLFLRKQGRPKINLEEILSDIDSRVTEAFRRELAQISTAIPESVLEESLNGFKETARLEFLKLVEKYWPDLRDQVYKLAPCLVPLPELSKEQLSRLKELQKSTEKAITKIESALQETLDALDLIEANRKREAELLRGTRGEGKGSLNELLSKLLAAIRNELGQWEVSRQGLPTPPRLSYLERLKKEFKKW